MVSAEMPGQDLRPSFFELYAQERLTLALRPALRYVLEVLSVRRPAFLRLAERSDELFALISSFVEMNQLSKKNSTLSESFYGLRRSANFDSPSSEKLTRTQIVLTVAFTVLLPYLKLKIDQFYTNNRPNDRGYQENNTSARSNQPPPIRIPAGSLKLRDVLTMKGLRIIVRLLKDRGFRERCKRKFLEMYPTANAPIESTCFVFNILYLFGHTRYFNPLLAMQGLVIRRVRGSELIENPVAHHHLESQVGLMPFLATVADKVVTGIKCGFIGGVFLIRFLEFYYAAESRLPRRTSYIPPPPAPLPPADDFDVKILKSGTLCPLCRRDRTNPAACAASGYVFCYPCIFAYIQEHGRCPVTKLESSLEDVVRVYEDQSL